MANQKSDMENLFENIACCKNVRNYFNGVLEGNGKKPHPCGEIIRSQFGLYDCTYNNFQNDCYIFKCNFQIPEPWSGHIDKAFLLFLGPNPSFSADEHYPGFGEICCSNSKQGEELPLFDEKQLIDFYDKRFENNPKKNSWSKYWKKAEDIASWFYGKKVIPGCDYALSEVVHCKSKGQEGVEEALEECTTKYLERLLDISPAKVVVVLGAYTKYALEEYLIKQATEYLIKQATEDLIKQTLAELNKKALEELNKALVELIKKAPEALIKKTLEELAKKGLEDLIKQTLAELNKKAPEELNKALVELIKKAPVALIQQAFEEFVEKVLEGLDKKVPEDSIKKALKGLNKKALEDLIKKTLEDLDNNNVKEESNKQCLLINIACNDNKDGDITIYKQINDKNSYRYFIFAPHIAAHGDMGLSVDHFKDAQEQIKKLGIPDCLQEIQECLQSEKPDCNMGKQASEQGSK